jgi:ferric-dicitrate binding protein FerR (iron transport regulator)
MEQKDFLIILKKYRSGTATPDEKKLVDEWCMAMEAANPVRIPNDIELKEQDWSNVARHIRNTNKLKKKGRIRLLWYSTGIAASLLIACAVYFSVINRQQTDVIASKDVESSATSDLKRVSTGNASQIAVLPDGSEVTLAPESELRFSESFDGSQREVYLEGEAFFNVSRDTVRPFLVYTNQVVTKVLGTTFTVKALRKEKSITVAVRTGKVSVYTPRDRDAKNADGAKEIILTPNQQIVYNKEGNSIARMIVDSPQKIIHEEEVKRMRLEDASASEILAAIEKVYGVDIVYDEQVFASCILTTSLSDGDLYNRMEAICQAIDATFRIEENKIVVTGPGCRN